MTRPNQSLNIDDLRLLHVWHRGIDLTFSDHANDTNESCQAIEIGFSHPYVLHMILAVSAFYSLHHNPTKVKLYEQASAHNLVGLQLARPHLVRTEQDNGDALLYFAAFNSIFALAEPPLRSLVTLDSPPLDPIPELLNAFRMSRGILAITTSRETGPHTISVQNKDIWKDNEDEVASTLEQDYPQMQVLQVMIESQCTEPQKTASLQAVRELFICFAVLQTNSRTHSSTRRIQTWPMHIDPLVLELMQHKHPAGLIMIAHYAALMSLRSFIWLFQRWPPLLMSSVEEQLEKQWKRYLEWPRAVMHENMHSNKS